MTVTTRRCPDKVRYADRWEAEHALASCELESWRGHPERRERRAYECPHCGGWHLTSQPRRDRRSAAA